MIFKRNIDEQIQFGIIRPFGGGPSYTPAAVTTPSSNDEEVQNAMQKERDLARKRKGRSSTILTSGLGLEDAGTKKTLLGQ